MRISGVQSPPCTGGGAPPFGVALAYGVRMDDAVKEASAAARRLDDDALRDRVRRLAFDGDTARYEAFLDVLRTALSDEVTVVARGSAVIGCRWADGRPFDADGPGSSDLDIALIGGDMLSRWSADHMYIPGLHSAPLDDKSPEAAPSLRRLRDQLCAIARRPVNLQATTGLVQFVRDVMFDQPYVILIEGSRRPLGSDAEQEANASADGSDGDA